MKKTVSRPMVLDAWPVMEWLKGRQPTAQQRDNLLGQAQRGELQISISRMNLGEIRYSLAKDFGETAGSLMFSYFLRFPVEVVSVTDADIDLAATLKSKYAFSYADAFAAVLCINRRTPLVTGDREFKRLEADGTITVHRLGR